MANYQQADLGALTVVSAAPFVMNGYAIDQAVSLEDSYIQFFNAAATADVTMGTTRPLWEQERLVGSSGTFSFNGKGIEFTTGLVIASTKDHWDVVANINAAGCDVMITEGRSGYRHNYAKKDLGAKQLVAAPCTFGGFCGENIDGATAFIQLFDAAAAGDVTLGTTKPVLEYELANNDNPTEALGPNGVEFTLGLVIASTTAHWGGTASGGGVDVMLIYD
jgi:hypothetical protein